MAPTSANGSPARFVFLTTEAAKNRLLPTLAPLNVEKTKTAPVTASCLGHGVHEHLPRLFPHADMRAYFVGNQPLIDETAFRNGSLQERISSWRRAPWDWIAVPCLASTPPR